MISFYPLGANLYKNTDPQLSRLSKERSLYAYQLGLDKPGVCQTAPNREPYYEEGNWADDMELGGAALYELTGDPKYSNNLCITVQKKK